MWFVNTAVIELGTDECRKIGRKSYTSKVLVFVLDLCFRKQIKWSVNCDSV